ncbi:MAG: metal ABC transporter solute-binding protein, Zn/Mn family [Alloprevotella sp.]
MKHLLPLLSLVLLAATWSSCSETPSDNRPTLTVSMEPLRFVTEAVAGDAYRVVSLMPKGASPETFDPTPRQLMELNSSQAVFMFGTMPFERSVLPRMTGSASGVALFEVAQDVKPLETSGHAHDSSSGLDPHVWMSVRNLSLMAERVCNALCEVEPDSAEGFRRRLTQFQNEMTQLDETLSQQLKGLRHRAFLIYHPALGYFARDYALRQLPVELDGKEATAARLEQLVNAAKTDSVRVVFVSEEHPDRQAQRLAEMLQTPLVRINPLTADVKEELLRIADCLAK